MAQIWYKSRHGGHLMLKLAVFPWQGLPSLYPAARYQQREDG